MRLVSILCACLLAVGCMHTSVIERTIPHETNVIAVMVGYCESMKLSTGQDVEFFTPCPTNAWGDEFLFSVLVPKDLRGRYFIVRDRAGPMNHNPGRIFKFGTRYRFTVNTNILISPYYGDTYMLVERGVKEAPVTKEEVDAYVEQLDSDISSCTGTIAMLDKRLKDNGQSKYWDKYQKSKTNAEKRIIFLVSLKNKAFELLNQATDNYADVFDLKWQALAEEGWNSIPRVSETNMPNLNANDNNK